jgi:pimeloyl-ACP methyl ester carboxylesterase
MTTIETRTDDGVRITAHVSPPAEPSADLPLIVALHGGTYTSDYFRIAGGPLGSFVDIARRNGFTILSVDRPGYGGSDLIPEETNTFSEQARILDDAITAFQEHIPTNSGAVLVGHSIGGMVALEIAARPTTWPLVGAAVSGMGARVPVGGAAEKLGSLPLEGVVDLPVPEREQLWYGPAGSVTEEAKQKARTSFAPAPMVELTYASTWAATRLTDVAPQIRVPVHHAMAEFDALWDPSPEARLLFLSAFKPTQRVHSEIVAGVGHCIDHHRLGAALHLRQLAFAHECAFAGRPA